MKQVQPDDLSTLARIFFPSHDEPDAASWFTCGKKPAPPPGHNCLSFGYICNPDGTIRWLYPLGSAQPIFLRLYNGSGWRGALLRAGFKTVFKLRMGCWARSGQLHVFYRRKAPLNDLLAKLPSSKMAIFTGTVGENRKAVVALEDSDRRSWFLKLPLTPAAADLLRNEERTLASIAQLGLRKMEVPTALWETGGLLVSDVWPTAASSSNDLQPAHFDALAELAKQTLQTVRLDSLPCWANLNRHLDDLFRQPNLSGLNPETAGRVADGLLTLRRSLGPDTVVPTAIAHGDFTPWNMYLGGCKIHVYDWELSERLPLLHDTLHFTIQSGVLVKKMSHGDLLHTILELRKSRYLRQILVGHETDFDTLLRLYLLHNVSYYLSLYLSQRPLHQQAHWLLAAWDAIIAWVLEEREVGALEDAPWNSQNSQPAH